MERVTREVLDLYQTKKGTKKGTLSCTQAIDKKNIKLPYWARNTLIAPLSSFWELKLKWVPKSNKCYLLQGSKGNSSQCLYMDIGCSKHTTGNIKDFISLKALKGRGISFRDRKKGHILGVGRIGKSIEESIENVYHVSGLKYKLLSVSHICDKGNEVKFTFESCTVTNQTTKKVVLIAQM